MHEQLENQYLGLSNKFYGDDTKKTFENRTSDTDWEPDSSIFASAPFKRYENDPQNPILLALLEEERLIKKAKSYKRSTPTGTFADNHYDPHFWSDIRHKFQENIPYKFYGERA